ncbi:hypothetical protein ACFWII_34920 [Streptomyces sp. NPDC127063]|uniref:hypothetical protein n=1 Tax=Streptomyces sp. NPDC127063 TaxID=3347123 RepID=UPI00364C471A
MIVLPLPYTPFKSSEVKHRPVRTMPRLVPYITRREGEESAPDDLVFVQSGPHPARLHYRWETERDRDLRGVLWARCSQTPPDRRGMPTGQPRWRLVHPARQRYAMRHMLCQVCVRPARTPLGYIFLEGPQELRSEDDLVLTAQPPVCAKHVVSAARLCPHLDGRPLVYLTQASPLYGVHGTVYDHGDEGVFVKALPKTALPYGSDVLRNVLASKLVRRLKTFQLITLEELMRALDAAAA